MIDIYVDDEYIYVALGGGLIILEVSTIPESGGSDFLPYIIMISVVVVVVGISIVLYFKIFKKKISH